VLAAELAPPEGEHGFRAALRDAQRRGDFPALPHAKPGPAPGSEQRGGSEGTGTGTLSLRTWADGTVHWYAEFSAGGERFAERLGLADAHHGLTREEAEQALHDLVQQPTPMELYSDRLDACRNLLRSVAGVHTVRLTPSTYRVLADQGWGEDIVLHAARLLVAAGLAEMRWEAHGTEAWPLVQRVTA
jgi:hypothetical protein